MTPSWRIALPTLIAVVGSGAALFLLRSDLAYFLEPRQARDLGDVTALGGELPGNRFVRLRGVANLASSLRVTSGAGAMRIVRLSGSPVLVQVPAPGPPGTPPRGEGGLQSSGLFDGTGRLLRAGALKAAYAPVLRRFAPSGPTHYLLVTGEEPGTVWASFAGGVAVAALGAVAVLLALRVMVRRSRASRVGGKDVHPDP